MTQVFMDVAAVRRRARIVLALLGPMIAAQFSLAYVYGTYSYVDLHDYIAGHARLPFQYRALPGWVMWAVLQVPGWGAVLPAAEEQMTPERLVWLLLVFASVLWILHSARQIAVAVFADNLRARLLGLSFFAPLYLNYAAPAYAQRFSYPYDLPSLALMMAGFVAIVRARWIRLLVLFALATFARETSLILLAIFLCWTWPSDESGRPALLPHARMAAIAGFMGATWLAEKVFLHALYGKNLSEAAFMHQLGVVGGVVLQVGGNMMDMLQPLRWPVAMSILCWLWLPVFAFWNRLDNAALQRSIRVITPYWIIAMCLFGALRETRVFGELTVLYWMAGLVLLRSAAGASVGGLKPTLRFSPAQPAA